MQRPARGFLIVPMAAALGLNACAWITDHLRPHPEPVPASIGVTAPAVDVITQHEDVHRSGANLEEVLLTPAAVTSAGFHRLFDWRVDGQIYAQPLYLSDVAYDGRIIDLVIVATMNNSVYAFEAPRADSIKRPAPDPLWVVGASVLGEPLDYAFFDMQSALFGYNIKPKIGIAATPVIDRGRHRIYLTVKTRAAVPGNAANADPAAAPVVHKVFALDYLAHGRVVAAATMDGRVGGAAAPSVPFDPTHHLQRAGLLEANDRIYAAFGSHQDTPTYHGWVMAFDAADLHPVATYCTTCTRDDKKSLGGIWQAGGGPAADDQGTLYVMTGNGRYAQSGADRASSFVALDRDLHPTGSWTPATHECLTNTDSDLGSAGPTYLADVSTLVGGGKEGVLYALQPAALQGTHVGDPDSSGKHPRPPCEQGPVPAPAGPGYWSIQASEVWSESAFMDFLRIFDDGIATQGYHHIHGAPAQWRVAAGSGLRTLLYVSPERDPVRAYEFNAGVPGGAGPGEHPRDTFHSRCATSSHGMPGGFLTLSANGADPKSGILWALMPRKDENALTNIVPGVLRAYQAYPAQGELLAEIWNSDQGTRIGADCADDTESAGSDQLGLFAKFVPPTVARGKVYAATFSNRLAVYGLSSPSAAPSAAAATSPPPPPPTAAHAMARTSTAEPYDAVLEVVPTPARVDAGSVVSIVVTATNTGAKTWHAADRIALSSPTLPESAYQPSEGDAALQLSRDVAPGSAYGFSFRFTAPATEAVQHYSWRLARRLDGAAQADEQWFGKPSAEWKFTTLRPECEAIRARAKQAIDRIKADSKHPAISQAEVETLTQDARQQHCVLDAAVVDPMGH